MCFPERGGHSTSHVSLISSVGSQSPPPMAKDDNFYVGSSFTWFGRRRRGLGGGRVRGCFGLGRRLVRSGGGLRWGGLV